jgi:membrane-associated protease RseP (regulator of RpoE activity)
MKPSRWKWLLVLAGLTAAMVPGANGQEAAAPPSLAMPNADDAVAADKLPEYWIGIALREADPALLAQLKLKQGVLVEEISPASPAEKAGLQQYDLIIQAGDAPIASGADLLQAVGQVQEGELSLTILRVGEKQTVAVTPAKRPRDQFVGPHRAAVQGSAPEAIERALRLWQNEAGGGPLELNVIGPAVAVRTPPQALPEGVRITVERDGKNAPRITVERGDESWTVTPDRLDKLPPELRAHASAMAGLPQGFDADKLERGNRVAAANSGIRIRELRDDPLARIEEELRQMRKEIEALRKSAAPTP